LVPTKDRLLWLAAVAVCSVGLLGWFWGYYEIWIQYSQHLPRSPNPASGNLYALNIHGIVVYQTLKQRSYRENWEFWSYAVCCCGAALGAVYQWRLRKRVAQR
jgi:hypothetical protein